MELRHRAGVGLLALALAGCPLPEQAEADAGPDQLAFLGEAVLLSAQLVEDDFDVRYEWHVDGEVLVGAFVDFTPERLGRIPVVLEVHDPAGRVSTDSLVLSVGVRPAPVPPRVSSRLAEIEAGVWAVAVPALDQVVEIAGGATTAYPTCAEPIAVAVQGTRIAAACASDQITRIQLADGASTTLDLPWGTRPQGLVWAGDEWRIAALGPGEVQALSELDASLLQAFPAPEAASLAIVRGWTTLAATRRAHGFVRADPDSRFQAFEEGLGPDSDTDSRGTPVMMEAMAVRADTAVVVFGGLKHNLARGELRDGRPLTFESTARAVLRAHDAESLAPMWTHSFDNRDRVSALAYSAHGDLLFVGHGAGIVDVLDAGTRQRLGGWTGFAGPIDAVREVGEELWVLVGTERALYQLPLDDLVGTADEGTRVDLHAGTPEPDAELALGERLFHAAGDRRMSRDAYLACASCHPDGGDDGHTWDFTDRGEGVRNTRSLRGGLHGLLHWSGNFDEVADFEGAIRAHHQGTGFLSEADWLATADPLGAPKAGLSAELDALAAYVHSLPALRSPHREPDGAMSEAALAGEAVFAAAGCANCHVPPTYTDSSSDGASPVLHDVGTLTAESGSRNGEPLVGLDTPSLRGLFATAPYLHDGSAPAVMDVLTTANPLDRHGVTSGLSADELAALEAFLLELE